MTHTLYALITAMYEGMLAYRTNNVLGGGAMFSCRKFGCLCGSECIGRRTPFTSFWVLFGSVDRY